MSAPQEASPRRYSPSIETERESAERTESQFCSAEQPGRSPRMIGPQESPDVCHLVFRDLFASLDPAQASHHRSIVVSCVFDGTSVAGGEESDAKSCQSNVDGIVAFQSLVVNFIHRLFDAAEAQVGAPRVGECAAPSHRLHVMLACSRLTERNTLMGDLADLPGAMILDPGVSVVAASDCLSHRACAPELNYYNSFLDPTVHLHHPDVISPHMLSVPRWHCGHFEAVHGTFDAERMLADALQSYLPEAATEECSDNGRGTLLVEFCVMRLVDGSDGPRLLASIVYFILSPSNGSFVRSLGCYSPDAANRFAVKEVGQRLERGESLTAVPHDIAAATNSFWQPLLDELIVYRIGTLMAMGATEGADAESVPPTTQATLDQLHATLVAEQQHAHKVLWEGHHADGPSFSLFQLPPAGISAVVALSRANVTLRLADSLVAPHLWLSSLLGEPAPDSDLVSEWIGVLAPFVDVPCLAGTRTDHTAAKSSARTPSGSLEPNERDSVPVPTPLGRKQASDLFSPPMPCETQWEAVPRPRSPRELVTHTVSCSTAAVETFQRQIASLQRDNEELSSRNNELWSCIADMGLAAPPGAEPEGTDVVPPQAALREESQQTESYPARSVAVQTQRALPTATEYVQAGCATLSDFGTSPQRPAVASTCTSPASPAEWKLKRRVATLEEELRSTITAWNNERRLQEQQAEGAKRLSAKEEHRLRGILHEMEVELKTAQQDKQNLLRTLRAVQAARTDDGAAEKAATLQQSNEVLRDEVNSLKNQLSVVQRERQEAMSQMHTMQRLLQMHEERHEDGASASPPSHSRAAKLAPPLAARRQVLAQPTTDAMVATVPFRHRDSTNVPHKMQNQNCSRNIVKRSSTPTRVEPRQWMQ